MVAYCHKAAVPDTVSASCLVNSSAIAPLLRQVLAAYWPMFRCKAFLHWYTGQGMDAMEFTEAEADLGDLISELANYQTASGTDGDDEREE